MIDVSNSELKLILFYAVGQAKDTLSTIKHIHLKAYKTKDSDLLYDIEKRLENKIESWTKLMEDL